MYFFQDTYSQHAVRPNGTKDSVLVYTAGGSGLYRFEGDKYKDRAGVFYGYQFSFLTRKWRLLFGPLLFLLGYKTHQ